MSPTVEGKAPPAEAEQDPTGGILAAGLHPDTIGPLRSALSTWGELEVEPDLRRALLRVRTQRPRLVVLPADRALGLASCDRLRGDDSYGSPWVWLLSEQGLTARLAAHCLLPTRAHLVSVLPLSARFVEQEVAPLLPAPARTRPSPAPAPRLFPEAEPPAAPPVRGPAPSPSRRRSRAPSQDIRKLQDALLGSRAESVRLRKELERAVGESRAHASAKLEAQAVLEATRSKLTERSRDLERARAEAQEASVRAQEHRAAGEAARASLRAAEARHQEQASVEAGARSQTGALLARIAALEATEQDLRKALRDTGQDRTTAMAALAEQTRLAAERAASLEKLQSFQAELTHERDAFRRDRDELSGERARLRSRNDRLEDDLRQSQHRLDALTLEHGRLSESSAEVSAERDTLRKERNRLVQEHVPLMEARTELERDLRATRVERTRLSDQLRRAEDRIKRLEGDLDRERSRSVELELELAEARLAMEEPALPTPLAGSSSAASPSFLAGELDRARARLVGLELELAETRAERDATAAVSADSEGVLAQVDRLEQEVDQLRSQCSDWQDQAASAKAAHAASQEALSAAEARAAQALADAATAEEEQMRDLQFFLGQLAQLQASAADADPASVEGDA